MIYDLRFKKAIKILFLSSAVIFLAAGCNQKSSGPRYPAVETRRTQIQVSHQVMGVDVGDQLFNFYEEENKTALDLVKSGHQVETKTFPGVGEYVVSINGEKENPGKSFWALYVNGQQSQVGASDYKPKNGDKIEWKLEEIK